MFIGSLKNVGFAKETTRGTAANIDVFVPKTNVDFAPKVESVNDESSMGMIADATSSYVTKQWGEGSIEGNVNINTIGHALLSAFGQVVSSETNGGGAYEHKFTVLQSNEHPTLTIGVNDPVQGDISFTGAMLESLEISAAVGGFVMFTATFKSKSEEPATHVVSYIADYTMLASFCNIYIADTITGLETVNNICVKSFSISITKNIQEDLCLSSISPVDFYNGKFSIEGSFNLNFDNTEIKQKYINAEAFALRFEIIDSKNIIGNTDSPTLIFDLPKVKFIEWSTTGGNDEIITQDVTFKAFYDFETNSQGSATLINTTDNY